MTKAKIVPVVEDIEASMPPLPTTPSGIINPWQLTRPKVAIEGFTGHRGEGFGRGDDWEVWGINELHRHHPIELFTRWFEIHDRGDFEPQGEGKPGDPEHLKQLAGFKIPIYMHKHWDDIPASVAFPRQEIIDWHNERGNWGEYQTSSISWEVAFALMLGAEEIGIFGVDMANNTEWCIGPDSRVLTDDLRWVPAGELKVGDGIIAFDENSGWQENSRESARRWRHATVESAEVITRPSYRVKLEDGTEFISSQEHRWLTRGEHLNRWKRTDELVTSHHREGRPTRIVKLLDTWEEDLSWEAGYLAGAFDGEGHLCQRPLNHCNSHTLGLGFAQRQNEMSALTEDILENFGFRFSGKLDDRSPTKKKRPVNKYQIKGGRPEIMRFLGSIRPRRLLAKFDPSKLGVLQRKNAVAVESAEFIGDQKVIALKTSTGTFVAEGFASHNSEQRNCLEYWIGVAGQMTGKRVVLPETCDLMTAFGQYGFKDEGNKLRSMMEARLAWLHQMDNHHRTLLRKLENDKMIADANYAKQHEQGVAHCAEWMGAINDCGYMLRSWMGTKHELTGNPTPDRTKDPQTGITKE